VIGGSIGALGAAAAVYLTLKLQRDDETETVSRAVLMEIAQLSKFPSGQLDNCIMIYSGKFTTCPREKFVSMMKTPDPVIYPSVAGQISRHPKVESIVAFYAGIQEARLTAELISEAAHKPPMLEPNDVPGLAIVLREQCRLASEILRAESPLSNKSYLSSQMIEVLATMLEKSVNKGDKIFPSVGQYEATHNVS
jgi:hypothetical protein